MSGDTYENDVPKSHAVAWLRSPEAEPIRFLMRRDVDVTGVSGTGLVAEGVMFSTGRVIIGWVTGVKSVGVYDDLMDLYNTSGHNGATWPDWLD